MHIYQHCLKAKQMVLYVYLNYEKINRLCHINVYGAVVTDVY